MSIIDPKIDVLLDAADNDRFLLCSLASKRAHDINDMMRGQRDRAIQLSSAVEIAKANNKKPLSMAFAESLAARFPTIPPRSTSRSIKLACFCAKGPFFGPFSYKKGILRELPARSLPKRKRIHAAISEDKPRALP